MKNIHQHKDYKAFATLLASLSKTAYKGHTKGECPPHAMLSPDDLVLWLRKIVPPQHRKWFGLKAGRFSEKDRSAVQEPDWPLKEFALSLLETKEHPIPWHGHYAWNHHLLYLLSCADKGPLSLGEVFEGELTRHHAHHDEQRKADRQDTNTPRTLPPGKTLEIIIEWQLREKEQIGESLFSHAPCPSTPPDTRRNGIVPASQKKSLLIVSPDKKEQEGSTHSGFVSVEAEEMAEVPRFCELLAPGSLIVPIAPLTAYRQMGGAGTTQGLGAPIMLRLYMELLLSVPRENRNGMLNKVVFTRRQLADWVWPSQRVLPRSHTDARERGYQPHRDRLNLHEAILSLNRLCVPYERDEHDNGKQRLWKYISLLDFPRCPSRDDNEEYVFIIVHRPNDEVGPLIDRALLREFGLRSAPQYFAFLRVAHLLAMPIRGRFGDVIDTVPECYRNDAGQCLSRVDGTILLERGKPITRWDHPLAKRLSWTGKRVPNPHIKHVPALNSLELARLSSVYNDPNTFTSVKNQARRTRGILQQWDDLGLITLDKDRGERGEILYRILRPWKRVEQHIERVPLRKKPQAKD